MVAAVLRTVVATTMRPLTMAASIWAGLESPVTPNITLPGNSFSSLSRTLSTRALLGTMMRILRGCAGSKSPAASSAAYIEIRCRTPASEVKASTRKQMLGLKTADRSLITVTSSGRRWKKSSTGQTADGEAVAESRVVCTLPATLNTCPTAANTVLKLR